jgi:Transketolase, C-terminal subunit
MLEFSKRNIRTWSILGPRGTFGAALYELARERNDFVVLSADLGGSSGLNRFMNSYPDQFMNVGIAEQNMIGIAAGLAKEGVTAFATSFAPFITLRSGEQVRLNLGYMKLNVKAVGIGSGVSMGYLGNSHYGLEDVAVMRAIPNMTIISPADGVEIVKTVFAAVDNPNPMYIRLTGATNCPIIYNEDYDFKIGRAVVLKEGETVAIIATGSMVFECMEAAKNLESQGISTMVINMHTIKPLDTSMLNDIFQRTKLVVTVEEHSVIGGLGSAVAQFRAEYNSAPPVMILGLPDDFGKAGDYQYLLNKYGLKGDLISKTILEKIKSIN